MIIILAFAFGVVIGCFMTISIIKGLMLELKTELKNENNS